MPVLVDLAPFHLVVEASSSASTTWSGSLLHCLLQRMGDGNPSFRPRPHGRVYFHRHKRSWLCESLPALVDQSPIFPVVGASNSDSTTWSGPLLHCLLQRMGDGKPSFRLRPHGRVHCHRHKRSWLCESMPALVDQCRRHGSSWVLICCHHGAQRDDSGPAVGDMGLDGFRFASIDSKSGTPIILGPVLATWVFMGSVLRQLIPDLVLQTSRLGSTG